MRHAIVTSLIILALAAPSWGQAADQVDSPSAAACASQSLAAMQSNPQVAVEVLEGSQAREHLEQLKKAHPGRFKGLGAALREHGAHPTNIVTVMRTRQLVLPGLQGQTNSSGAPNNLETRSDSASDADGEVIFSSWDDGDDSTWEGTIYTVDYSDGSWSTWEGQANIASADYYGVWGSIVASGRPGGDPLPKSTTGSETIAGSDMASIGPKSWSSYWPCLAAGAYGCTQVCVFAGPYLPHCLIGCAAFTAIRCAIYAY